MYFINKFAWQNLHTEHSKQRQKLDENVHQIVMMPIGTV